MTKSSTLLGWQIQYTKPAVGFGFATLTAYMTKAVFALVLMVTLVSAVGCDSPSTSSATASQAETSNGIFSTWTQPPNNSNYTTEPADGALYLEGGEFNQSSNFRFQIYTGAVCTADILISGDNSSGTMVFSNIVYVSGGLSNDDCEYIFGEGYSFSGVTLKYTVSNNDLTLSTPPQLTQQGDNEEVWNPLYLYYQLN